MQCPSFAKTGKSPVRLVVLALTVTNSGIIISPHGVSHYPKIYDSQYIRLNERKASGKSFLASLSIYLARCLPSGSRTKRRSRNSLKSRPLWVTILI